MTDKRRFCILIGVSLIVPLLIIYGVTTWIMWGWPALSELHALTRLLMLCVLTFVGLWWLAETLEND